MHLDLAIVWAGILAFGVFAYVVMDGFDLGIGILFPTLKPGTERDIAMNSIAPVWDGNETWLVLGGGGLMAAFPLAFAILLPALYAPITAMLLALVFRGVALEFRWRDPGHRPFWDFAFATGSVVASLAQGITLGALLQGVAVNGRGYGGGWWDWLTPFSLLTGVSVLVGFGLAGLVLAHLEDRGGSAGEGVQAVAAAGCGTRCVHCRSEPCDPVPVRRVLPALVRVAECPLHRAGAAAGTGHLGIVLPQPRATARAGAFPVRPRAVSPHLCRAHDQHLPRCGAERRDYLGGCCAGQQPQLHAGGRGGAAADHPGYTGHAYWVFRGKVGMDGYH
jgi:cytochrome d ubiquinol oxidase subunit II